MPDPETTSPPDRLRAAEPRDRIVEFFDRLDASNMGLVDDFYAEDCHFVDPLGELRGRGPLREYYARLYADVEEIGFDFDQVLGDGAWYAAPWTMRLRAKLGGGKTIEVPGISRIRFAASGKVDFHQDYFDLGAFVYENVPVLRRAVRFVKKRLSGH